MDPATEPVLVVGASRILAPAARALADRGERVLTVSRSGADLAVDARDGAFLDLLPSGIAGALLYGPAVSTATLTGVVDRSAGPVVLVLTSSAADPDGAAPSLPPGARELVLGWRPDRTWHSPEEISLAALAVYDSAAAPRVLGLLRPWTDRPA